MLDPIQNQALRLCLGAFRTTPADSLQIEANEPPLHLRRLKLLMQYCLKTESNPDNPVYDLLSSPANQDIYQSKPSSIPNLGCRYKKLLRDMEIDPTTIHKQEYLESPPWMTTGPKYNWSLNTGTKKTALPTQMRTNFLSELTRYHDHTQVYTDGSKINEKVGCAVVLDNLTQSKRLPNNATIHTAELWAIKIALEMISLRNENKFVICSDSSSAIQSIMNFEPNNPLATSVLNLIHYLKSVGKDISILWTPSHVGINGNEKADSAAKEAINLNIEDVKIPHSDHRQSITNYLTQKWQDIWDNAVFNKLRSIKPKIGKIKLPRSIHRKDQTIVHRLRLGHTRYTHTFLLRNEECPTCHTCQTADTVEHFIAKCTRFRMARETHLRGKTLSEIFDKTLWESLINYVIDIGLYHTIPYHTIFLIDQIWSVEADDSKNLSCPKPFA